MKDSSFFLIPIVTIILLLLFFMFYLLCTIARQQQVKSLQKQLEKQNILQEDFADYNDTLGDEKLDEEQEGHVESLHTKTIKTPKNIYVLTNVEQIYDKFFSKVYKKMISSFKVPLMEHESDRFYKKVRTFFPPRDKDYSLQFCDLGCGPGSHGMYMVRNYANIHFTGFDISSNMLDILSTSYQKLRDNEETNEDTTKEPKNKISIRGRLRATQGTFFDKEALTEKKFHGLSMFYFSFYYASHNLTTLLNNVHTWGLPGCIFMIHLVDPERFDAMLDAANLFVGFSLNKYKEGTSEKNVSRVVFKDFEYTSRYDYNKERKVATFTETIDLKKKQTVRKHVHELSMMSVDETIEQILKSQKFKLLKKESLINVGYADQYLVYFQAA